MSDRVVTSHSDLSDLQFLGQFRICQLDSTLFNHEAHLRLAWLYLERYEILMAEELVRTDIMNYVENHYALDKYHDTLTIASVKIVEHYREKTEGFSFGEMIFLYPQLVDDFKALLLSHYSSKKLNSARAKKKYTKPDLVPFSVVGQF